MILLFFYYFFPFLSPFFLYLWSWCLHYCFYLSLMLYVNTDCYWLLKYLLLFWLFWKQSTNHKKKNASVLYFLRINFSSCFFSPNDWLLCFRNERFHSASEALTTCCVFVKWALRPWRLARAATDSGVAAVVTVWPCCSPQSFHLLSHTG